MNSGDARIPDANDPIAHRLGRQRGLLGHRDIACSRGDDGDLADAALRGYRVETTSIKPAKRLKSARLYVTSCGMLKVSIVATMFAS